MRSSAWVMGSVVLLRAGAARADGDAGGFLSPGVLWGPGAAKSIGAELSYTHYPNGLGIGVGPLVQAEWLRPREPRGGTYRSAFGFQAVVTGLGVETAFHYQGPRAGGGGAGVGTTLGVFGSLGLVSFGVRRTAPLTGGDPAETTFVMTVKWVILAYGENPYRLPAHFMDFGASHQGRPLCVRGALGTFARVAPLRRETAWSARDVRAAPTAEALRDRLVRAAEERA